MKLALSIAATLLVIAMLILGMHSSQTQKYRSLNEFEVRLKRSGNGDYLEISGIVDYPKVSSALTKHTSVKTIEFRNAAFGGDDINLPSIQTLFFSLSRKLTEDYLQINASNLQQVYLSHCDSLVNNISVNSQTIREIQITNSSFIGTSGHWVLERSNLKSLRVTHGEIDEEFARSLSVLPLEDIDFGQVQMTSDKLVYLLQSKSLITLAFTLPEEEFADFINELERLPMTESELDYLLIRYQPSSSRFIDRLKSALITHQLDSDFVESSDTIANDHSDQLQ